MATTPNQALPLAQKDETWAKQTIDSFIERASFRVGSSGRKLTMSKMYDYYNGFSHHEDYQYVLAPYGGKQRKNFPAEMRTFPIIKPAVDLLLGEKIKRPFNFSVVISNPDVITIKEEAKKEAILKNMYQWFVNKLNEEGMETGMESEEVELPEHVEKIFDRNWKDHRAIMAQNALQYLIPFLRWEEKQQKGWFHFLVSGHAATHKGVLNNEVFYEVVNPLEVDWDRDPNNDFIEDCSWVVLRQLASRASIVDKYNKILTKEQINQLQNPKKTNQDGFFWNNDRGNNIYFDEWDDYSEVCTVYWKSLKLIGFRKYIDEYGEQLEEVVEEDYIAQDGDTLDWRYINEVWQAVRIDGDIYLDVKPFPHQRTSIDNPSICKLPVNGRAYSDINTEFISFVLLGIPYQITYDIYKYRLEAAIARSKDILAMMDINLIPEGWDMDKFMMIIEATGFAWVDFAKEGLSLPPTYQSVMDLSVKTIGQYIELLRYIKEEWEQVSGVTRQRMGEMSQYEGQATGQQSIIQSSHITEDMFKKYSYLEERDLQGLIDYSQLAWINGKKTAFTAPDGSQLYLDIDEEYSLAEVGIFLSDSAKENEKLMNIKQLTGTVIEQGAPLSLVASMMEAESFVVLKDKIREAEAMTQELEAKQQEAQQQMAEAERQSLLENRAHEEKLKLMELNNRLELEYIKQAQDSTEDTSWKKELEDRKLNVEQQLKQLELRETARSNRAKEEIEKMKVRASKVKSR